MIEIGKNIRLIRQKQNCSIKEISEKTGLTISHLSKIERGLVSPSLVALEKIAEAFRVPVTALFSAPSTDSPVVKKNERQEIVLPQRIVESLTKGNERKSMGIYYCIEGDDINGSKKRPKSEEEISFFSHPGEEFILVIEGEMRYFVGMNEYLLQEGDSIYYDSNIKHGALRLSPQLKLLIVTTPSTMPPDMMVAYSGNDDLPKRKSKKPNKKQDKKQNDSEA
ncbi:MAG TPA: helix-turn-helix domain-containing protein [Peptococcaceae bacterium]|nr:helix-turn-helix domain-containing protein [Peptococcaceae bacterium]